MFEWNDLRLLIAIAENRTLSAAARAVALNQSTMSRALMRIESQVKLPIFTASSQGYELTRDGSGYYKIAKEMERVFKQMTARDHAPLAGGRVSLTTTETFAGYLLERLDSFHAMHGISIEINGSNRIANLSRREFHCALRLEREQKSKALITKKVAEIALSGYQKKGDAQPSNWIGYEAALAAIPEEKWLRKNAKVSPTLRVSSYGTMEKAIQNGLGRGLLPDFIGQQNLLLQRTTGTHPVLHRALWFIAHPESRHMPVMRTFTSWLFRLFEEDRKLLG